jgi:hypothetical protein
VFLDFDDVICLPSDEKPGCYDLMHAMSDIHSGKKAITDFEDIWCNLFDPAAVANLATLSEEFDPIYVLSTSWTRFLDLSSLRLVLEQTGLTFVADSLHSDWETQKVSGSTRAQEISNWLSNHPDVENWLVIDDDWSGTGFENAQPKVVLCKVGKGFSNQELKQAWTVLQQQSEHCDSSHFVNARHEVFRLSD